MRTLAVPLGLVLVILTGCRGGDTQREKPDAPGARVEPAIPTPVPPARGGWRYATWGMSLDALLDAGKGEVKRLLIPVEEQAGSREGKSQSGATTIPAEIPALELAGSAFLVRFQFKGGALERIVLTEQQARAPDTFTRLGSELIREHGEPHSREVRGSQGRVTWNVPGSSIELVSREDGSVVLTYQRLGEENGNARR